MATPPRLTRLAGAFYLLMAILGGFAHVGVRAGVRIPGDAAATVGRAPAESVRRRPSHRPATSGSRADVPADGISHRGATNDPTGNEGATT